VDLPASKIELRPSFDLAVLAEASGRDVLITQLAWFLQQARHRLFEPGTKLREGRI
jgi:hypothetical protein